MHCAASPTNGSIERTIPLVSALLFTNHWARGSLKGQGRGKLHAMVVLRLTNLKKKRNSAVLRELGRIVYYCICTWTPPLGYLRGALVGAA